MSDREFCDICGSTGLVSVDLLDGSVGVVRSVGNQILEEATEDVLVACSCHSGSRFCRGEKPLFRRFNPDSMSISEAMQ